MIAAIMQPYFFPYIGYFQLMQAVDTFVLHDDVQYIKAGWINRNRILLNSSPSWLTLPVDKGSSLLRINERKYQLNEIGTVKKRLITIYSKAPQFVEIYPFICELLDQSNSNVAVFNSNLLMAVAHKLRITCSFLMSSSMGNPIHLRGEAKVIAMCQRIKANQYINPIGGIELYNGTPFSEAGVALSFLRPNTVLYKQFDSTPLPFLSIIDVLMFNSLEKAIKMLDDYCLVIPEKTSTQ
jgi:hypothetical protein